jgi:transcriptional regulator with XRE-family HTH domain
VTTGVKLFLGCARLVTVATTNIAIDTPHASRQLFDQCHKSKQGAMRWYRKMRNKDESCMKPNLVAIGARLREARQLRGVSQPDMARLVGKSKQLVSAWEQGRSEILISTLATFAQILSVDINWLLLGVKTEGSELGLATLPKGTLVPVLTPDEVIEVALGRLQLANIINKAYSYYPTEQGSLGFEMQDASMDGIVSRGEFVIIDPSKAIEPGGFVAAVVLADNGASLNFPILVLREISFLSTCMRQPPFDLTPHGRGYPKINIQKPHHVVILGTLCVSIRRNFPHARA